MKVRGCELCDELARQLHCSSDTELAGLIGVTPGRISQLRSSKEALDARYIAMLIKRVATKHADRTLKSAVQPIVEFFPIEKSNVRENGRDIPFDTQHKKGKQLAGTLRSATGLYAFYNSQAEIIYFGKTEKLNLYDELVNAFNRELKNRTIYRVRHPWGKYKSTEEARVRKIQKEAVRLTDIASYFSAYSVERAFIGALEAMLIRITPNDLINTRIESKDMTAFTPAIV